MTQNQIRYWEHKENVRHNTTTETETNRHNVVTERETERNNRFNNGIDLGKLNESVRHNQATERLGLLQHGETVRSNVARETENYRHNSAVEGIDMSKLGYSYDNLGELIRSNKAQEALRSYDLSIAAGLANEQQRHNIMNERLEQNRLNLQDELQSSQINLNNTKAQVERLQGIQGVGVNQSRINEIKSQIKEAQQRIEASKANMTRENVDQVRKYVDSISKLIDALYG